MSEYFNFINRVHSGPIEKINGVKNVACGILAAWVITSVNPVVAASQVNLTSREGYFRNPTFGGLNGNLNGDRGFRRCRRRWGGARRRLWGTR